MRRDPAGELVVYGSVELEHVTATYRCVSTDPICGRPRQHVIIDS